MAETAAATPSKPSPRTALPPGEVRVQEVLVIAVSALVLATVAFGVFARIYYARKLLGVYGGDPVAEAMIPELAWDAVKATYMWSYAVFSIGGTAAITGAVLWPREVGHALAVAFGLGFLIAAGQILFASPLPALVGFMLAGLGVLMLGLAWTTWRTKDRAAWAFLFALSGTLAIVMFFGAPRIRATLDQERLFYVLILPAAMSAIAVACYRLRRQYP
jgi:hypothetical protein